MGAVVIMVIVGVLIRLVFQWMRGDFDNEIPDLQGTPQNKVMTNHERTATPAAAGSDAFRQPRSPRHANRPNGAQKGAKRFRDLF